MGTSEIISLVSSLGFPIVVAWYLLTKMNKTIEENTKSNQALIESNHGIKDVLSRICTKLDITEKGENK